MTTTPALHFAATRWTVVLTAGQGQAGALEESCRTYWYPLYAYVSRRCYDAHEAAVRLKRRRKYGVFSPHLSVTFLPFCFCNG
ncbi:MAG TPA: hypothetical protein VL171_03470 [Verrucomicrobiae bacterium]|nr:hypothetical protein [Verrucomicrobiae bacterium]